MSGAVQRLSLLYSTTLSRHTCDPIEYHSFLAKGWTARYQSRGFSRRLALFRRLLSIHCKPGSIWLDAGCGSGVLSRELAALGAKGKGIDASSAMVALATSESLHAAHQFCFECVNGLEEIDAVSLSLDGILCSSVLEYVSSPSDVLNEFSRLLRPNGVLVLSVPNKTSLLRFLQSFLRLAGRCIGRETFSYLRLSRHAFTRKEVSLALSRLGFKVIHIELFDPVLPGWSRSLVPPSLFVFVAIKKDF